VQLLNEKGLLEYEEIFECVTVIKAKTGISGMPRD
jgi:hypothetical protein